MNNRILVIDDQENILDDFRTILSDSGAVGGGDLSRAISAARVLGFQIEAETEETYLLTTALQGEEGYELVRRANSMGEPYAVAFIDVRMPPGWDGMKTAAEIRKIDRDIEIVIVTAYSDRDRREIIKAIGSSDKVVYLKKPFDVEEIRQLALCLSQKWGLHRKEREHRQRLENLLRKITTIKTYTGDSRILLGVVLEDAVGEMGAVKGLVVSLKDGIATAEARHGQFDDSEIEGIFRLLPRMNAVEGDIVTIEGYTILPLRTDETEAIVVFGNIPREEDRPFLELFLSSISELINNARLFEKGLRNEKMASIGLATRTILHDLMNPLMHISASLDFCLTNSALPDDLRKWIGAANDGAKRINEMVTDISDFTLGRIQLQMAPVVLSSFMRDVTRLWNAQLERSRVELCVELSEDTVLTIDRARFQRVMDNVIINAVEAMEKSALRRLTISGEVLDGRVSLRISDSGPGIPDGIRSRIFDPFQSFGKRRGTGLGLAIAKQLVELHGGRLTFETATSGTTFSIELPQTGSRVVKLKELEDDV